MTMNLRGGVIGCGGFAVNHLHGWKAVDGAVVAAVCDLDERRAAEAADAFGIERWYGSAEAMLEAEALDFIDVVTQPHTHRELVELGARHGVPVICQKPLAPSMEEARAMVTACRGADIPFMVHENFRWQRPLRAAREAVKKIGAPFFGRISFRSAYDVFSGQPYLAEDEQFIIYDLGVHLLDLARFYMGEVVSLRAHTLRVNPRIKGEDVATILLEMAGGRTCVAEMSYASVLKVELFPQTLVHLEGANGSVVVGPNYELTTVVDGEPAEHASVPPDTYSWSTPPAEAIQDSVVRIQQHWVDCLRHGAAPETSGIDNLRTLELVFGAYASVDHGDVYHCQSSD